MTTTATTLQRTPLFQNHVNRGARVVDFSGWEMPVQYGKMLDEHAAVRNAAGLFDISHMGLVIIKSGDIQKTAAFLDALTPQDITALYPGKAVYTQLLNEAGGIIDDIIVYMLPENPQFAEFGEFMVIVNAGNRQVDLDWFKQHAPADVSIELVSDRYSLMALQGPKFFDALKASGYTGDQDSLPKRFHNADAVLGDFNIMLARTGYTGEDGVEIIVKNSDAEKLWNHLLEKGKSLGLLPIGLAARDTLRLEAAYPLHGHDIDPDISPLEAGLGWSVKLQKQADFIGKAALQAQKESGPPRKFYCFTLPKGAIARQHDVILKGDKPVGEITSGSISPVLGVPIAMGLVSSSAELKTGDMIQIQVRGKAVDATVVPRPFYKPA